MNYNFEEKNLKTEEEENNKDIPSITLVELYENKINENKINKINFKYIIYIIFGLFLLLLLLFVLFGNDNYLIKYIINNEKIKNFILSLAKKLHLNNVHPSSNIIIDVNKNNTLLEENSNKTNNNYNISKADDNEKKVSENYEQKNENENNENYNITYENKIEEREKNDNKEINSEKDLIFYTPKTFGEKQMKISFNYDDAIKAQLNKKLNDSILKSFPKDKLKYALCSIGKLENLYVRDFVIYYLELGVDKIFIYDNNEVNGEKFEDVVQDFIDKKLVEIIDMRGYQEDSPRKYAHDSCYQKHKNEYDWFLFFDFDEYLYIENKTLDNYVKSESFNKCSSIAFFLRYYTDNGQLYYSTESPVERFPTPVSNEKHRNHFLAKVRSMARGEIQELTYLKSIHIPHFQNNYNDNEKIICNSKGETFIDDKKLYNKLTFKNAYLKHFWRSAEEMCFKIGIRKYFKYYNWKKSDYIFVKEWFLLLSNNNNYRQRIMLDKCLENYFPKSKKKINN